MCVVARNSVDARLPEILSGQDLSVIPGVTDMDAIANTFSATGEELVIRTAQFKGVGKTFALTQN
jgi:hypothetical protein